MTCKLRTPMWPASCTPTNSCYFTTRMSWLSHIMRQIFSKGGKKVIASTTLLYKIDRLFNSEEPTVKRGKCKAKHRTSTKYWRKCFERDPRQNSSLAGRRSAVLWATRRLEFKPTQTSQRKADPSGARGFEGAQKSRRQNKGETAAKPIADQWTVWSNRIGESAWSYSRQGIWFQCRSTLVLTSKVYLD